MYQLKTYSKQLLADTVTPVQIYLKLRDVFAGSILLESADYRGKENSLSFICCQPIASFCLQDEVADMHFPDGSNERIEIEKTGQVLELLKDFTSLFKIQNPEPSKFPTTGLFGYMAYDAARYFEDVNLKPTNTDLPDILYKLYRFVIVIDHFSEVIKLFETGCENQDEVTGSGLDHIEQLIFSNRFSTFPFHLTGTEIAESTDEEFLRVIEEGKTHCQLGDVFQIVLSRRFNHGFKGDEFNVYRALRSINPSPYLFYFDFGNFKLFGSSPEAQLQVKGGVGTLYPIAGTYRRTGDDKRDAENAERLFADEKECAEHVMLVDLARNDLSRHARGVKVDVFKEIQYYSHVIHLVSKVTGSIGLGSDSLQLAADTFPAGTLSGAPKHRAMTLINQLEKVDRGYYGGAIGYIGFDGSFNHAIMIRTFLSKNNKLTFQAGAGVVAKSIPQRELEEVNNKLGALRKAIRMAETL